MPGSSAVLVFVSLIAAVYVLAASTLVRMALRRVGWMSPSSRRTRNTERAVLLIAVVGVLCFAYGYFVEPFWPEVTHVKVRSAKLVALERPIRLVQISDLHSDPRVRLEDRLPDMIAAQRPDVIVFTGDSINSPAALPVLRKLMTRLSEIAPTFAVRGNWDTGYWGREDLFGGTGVTELDGRAVELKLAGASIWIAGAPYGSIRKIETALNAAPADAYTVLLYHTPDEILDVAATKRVDLYCAGHTHGGQVALPFYGALITLSKYGKMYEAGRYREGDTWLYVNRGVGMEGGSAPRVRFMARPEITVFDISKEK